MNCTQCIEALDDYVDGEAAAELAADVTAHLAVCPDCRQRHDALRAILAAADRLPRESRPARDLWPEVAAGLEKPAVRGRFPSVWLAAAASFLLLLGISVVVWQRQANAPAFLVTRIGGAPQVAGRSVAGDSHLRVGQWLETDAASTARVEVATIGAVTLQPNSRLRLVGSSPTEHRMELVRGSLEAFVVAPPRLFVIDTPAATAIDLGCAYTIAVDERGNGLLHVTLGYVALARQGREETVRAGMMCAMRSGVGPGTPFVADAPAALRVALDRLDFETPAALTEVLAQARPQADALTLWHLLSRVAPGQRGGVFDVLASAMPPPAGVTRAGVLAGDASMLEAWERDLVERQGGWVLPPATKK